MPFTDISGFAAQNDQVLGRLSFSWALATGSSDPASFQLTIIKEDGSTERTLPYLGSDREALEAAFNGLAVGTYAAVLTAKDSAGIEVKSSVITGIEITTATSIGGIQAEAKASGALKVQWTPIAGFGGQYRIFLNGVQKHAMAAAAAVDASHEFAWEADKNVEVQIKASILTENDAVSALVKSKMDKQVAISEITLEQNAEQLARGTGIVSWTSAYASAGTTYVVEASGVNVASKVEFAAFTSGSLMNFGKAGQYVITVKAMNASAAPLGMTADDNQAEDNRDNGVMASATKTVEKALTITGLAAKYNAVGKLVLEANDMKFMAGTVYDASVNGVSYPMTLQDGKYKTAEIAGLADGSYPFTVKAMNNGEQASGSSTVVINADLALSGLNVDLNFYPSKAKVNVKWVDSRSGDSNIAGASVQYTYKIRNAETGLQVATGTKSATAAGDLESELVSLPKAAAYIARVEFNVNGRAGHDEIAFVVKAGEHYLQLGTMIQDLSPDSHKLMFNAYHIASSLHVDYQWTVETATQVPQIIKQGSYSAAGQHFGHALVNSLTGLDAGFYYFKVSALWYGQNIVQDGYFGVTRQITKVSHDREGLKVSWAAPTGMVGASYEVKVKDAAGLAIRTVAGASSPLLMRDLPLMLAGHNVEVVATLGEASAKYTLLALADGMGKAVKVNLRAEIEADGQVNIFEGADLISGNLVVAEEGLSAASLYRADTSEGLIQFWEPLSAPGDISGEFTVDGEGAARGNTKGDEVAQDLLEDLHAALVGQLDAHEAQPFARFTDAAYNKFAGIGKMALAYAADRLFGHPAATAAITNDAAIIASMENDASNNEFSPAMSAAVPANAKLARRLVESMLFKGTPTEVAARARAIVAAVVGQDSDRARGQDNNMPAPEEKQILRFYPGDEVYFQIKFKGFKASRGLGAPGAPAGSPNDATLEARLTEETFLFKCIIHA